MYDEQQQQQQQQNKFNCHSKKREKKKTKQTRGAMNNNKFYCHVHASSSDVQPHTFVCHTRDFAHLEALFSHIRERFFGGDESVFLRAEMEDGTQLKRMEDIRNKSDVTVKAVDENGDALLCVQGVEGRPLEGVMMHGKALEVAKEKADATVKAVDGNGEGSLVEKFKKEGNTLWVQGRPLEAVMMYGKALEVATEKADVSVLHCNRALVYLKLEMWDEAVADAQMATSLDPGVCFCFFCFLPYCPFPFHHFALLNTTLKNVKACFRWGQGLFGQGKFLEAQRVLGEALDIEAITNQQALEVGLLIAKCEKMGGPDKAADAVDVASARTARLPVSVYVRLKPYYAIAIQAMEENRWAHAIAIYQKVLEIYPNDYTSLLGLGSCLLRNKSHRYVEAVEVLKRLCSAHGTEASFEAWRMLGEAQHGAGLREMFSYLSF